MNNDLVSVIMPAYNAEKYISEAIDSVIQQTYTSWELIIVDDGSTDKTAKIVKAYSQKDSRVRYVFQSRQGQGSARNNGWLQAAGEYIAFLDADDLWLTVKLETQIGIMKANDVDLTFSDAYIFEEKPTASKKMNVKPGYYQGKESVLDFLSGNPIPLLTALVKKLSIQKVNGFSGMKNIHEDYDLWLRMLIAGHSFLGVEPALAHYRVYAGSSSSGEGKILSLNINTLQHVAQLHPEYKKAAEESIVNSIDDYLAKNNISHWQLADRLISVRNKLDAKKISLLFWKTIYMCFGKNIFRMLFHLRK